MLYFDMACHHSNVRIREVGQVHLLQSHGSSASIKFFFFQMLHTYYTQTVPVKYQNIYDSFEIWDLINSFIILVFLLLVFWHSYIHLHIFEAILRFFFCL